MYSNGRYRYQHFSVGDWALRAVVGATVSTWDKSDEPMPPGWQPEFYMPDWTLDKRKRFEALARCAFVLLPQGDQ